MQKINIVIIDKFNPSDGGSQLLQKLVNFLPNDTKIIDIGRDDFGFFLNLLRNIFFSKYFRYLRRLNIFSSITVMFSYKILVKLFTKRTFSKLKFQDINGIYTISNDILPFIVIEVAKRKKCPFHISIFDLPYTFILSKGEKQYLKRNFYKVLDQASSCDYTSLPMKDYCEAYLKNRLKSIVLWGSDGKKFVEINKNSNNPIGIEFIAYCGSIRFRRELQVLIASLERIDKLHNIKIKLKLFTRNRIESEYVINMGYIYDEYSLVQELLKCDLSYTPLSFSLEDEILVKTSFPSKIATYLSCGLPIIAHAPNYASNYLFAEKNMIGTGINTLDVAEFSEKLFNYVKDIKRIKENRTNIQKVLSSYFSVEDRINFYNDLF